MKKLLKFSAVALLGLYACVWGFLLGVTKSFFFFTVVQRRPISAIPQFLFTDWLTQNGFSDYPIYVELMLLPFVAMCCFLLIKECGAFLRRYGKMSAELVFELTFCCETMFGLLLLTVMILPLYFEPHPEMLHPAPDMSFAANLANWLFAAALVCLAGCYVFYRQQLKPPPEHPSNHP